MCVYQQDNVDNTVIEINPHGYAYQPQDPSGTQQQQVMEWYVNFADRNLFGYYGGTLLAQDELQVLEHPGNCIDWWC